MKHKKGSTDPFDQLFFIAVGFCLCLILLTPLFGYLDVHGACR